MNIQTLIAAVKIITLIGSTLVDMIGAAESLFPAGGNGAEKLKIVKSWIQAVVGSATELDSAWPAIESAINILVPLVTKKP